VELQQKMAMILERLGYSDWEVHWTPDTKMLDCGRRGEIMKDDKLMLIYDLTEERAHGTFCHELGELALYPMLRPLYRIIDLQRKALEDLAYRAKEHYLDEALPNLLAVLSELKAEK